MAPDGGRTISALSSGINGFAVLVYIDNDIGGLGQSIDSLNDHDNIVRLLRVLVFVNMASAFELSSVTHCIGRMDKTYGVVEQIRARAATLSRDQVWRSSFRVEIAEIYF
jgi:hypothetical protein